MWIVLGIFGVVLIVISIGALFGTFQGSFNIPNSSQGITALLNVFESRATEVIVEFIVFFVGLFITAYAYNENQRLTNPEV